MASKFTVDEVANYFLAKQGMTPKKLQKMLYFAYSWYLTFMNERIDELEDRLFNNNFEAWIHGPVDPSIYAKYKGYGGSKIPQYRGEIVQLEEEVEEIMDEVWDIYGRYSGNELESISHQHDPWKDTRKASRCADFDWCDAKITDGCIYKYYTAQLVQEEV